MKCPVCGQADLVHDKRNQTYTYKDQTFTLAVEADWCNACGESLTGPEESRRVMALVTLQRKLINTAADNGQLIRTVRKQLQLTQRDAGRLFGGGANAFSRYERGDTEAPTPLVKLFRLLQAHPELGDEVKRTG